MKHLSLLFIILAAFFLFSLPSTASAGASLYLAPSAGNYTVGNTFLVQVKVNTGGVAINVVDATLIFNSDSLEVVSISKTGSVFSLWVQEPEYSNSVGTIEFAGGKPSPGYTGAAGNIINITFKAKTAGTANVTFAVGSVLADDGKGTNILTNMGSGSYVLSAKSITPITPTPPSDYVPPITPSGQTPFSPVVSSPTHAEEQKWYSNNNPEFTWKPPSDVIAVSVLLHKKPDANPGNTSDGLIDSKKFEEVEDGAWYFHIKFRNQYGWGEITHRKVLIDTEEPEPFEVSVDNEGNPTNPTPLFSFQTDDSLSGIDHYTVEINGYQVSVSPQEAKEGFRPAPQGPGSLTALVKAFDKAGNFSQASVNFTIEPIGGIEITKIPSRIQVGEILEVEGKTLANIIARVYVQKEGEEEIIMEKVYTDAEGRFILRYGGALATGKYFVWAQGEDARGALTTPTQKYTVEIGLPPFLKFGKIALDYLSIMITLIVLIIGAIAIIFYSWYQISVWRKRARAETQEVSQSVRAAFRALREEVEEQISQLDQKPGLTKKEKAIRDKLQEALDMSEKFIGKEIEDVEKELE